MEAATKEKKEKENYAKALKTSPVVGTHYGNGVREGKKNRGDSGAREGAEGTFAPRGSKSDVYTRGMRICDALAAAGAPQPGERRAEGRRPRRRILARNGLLCARFSAQAEDNFYAARRRCYFSRGAGAVSATLLFAVVSFAEYLYFGTECRLSFEIASI